MDSVRRPIRKKQKWSQLATDKLIRQMESVRGLIRKYRKAYQLR
jgi:hypothetical protein